MEFIEEVIAREVLDSRGNPTVEVEVVLGDGIIGRALVPSGASTGSYEAVELRDRDDTRYLGKGVQQAIANIVDKIAPEIEGIPIPNQLLVDQTLIRLDGTENKSVLGANAILAVSMAVATATANHLGIPLYQYLGGACPNTLPVPMLNVINGGRHANNNLDIQEFMIVPAGFESFSDALRASCEIYHTLRQNLDQKGFSTSVGDEGGFAPSVSSHEEALSLLVDAMKMAGYLPGKNVWLALDCAASEFYFDGSYKFSSEARSFTSQELANYYYELVQKFPIISIEDPFDEEDWSAFAGFSAKLGGLIQVVGDDIYVTNPKRIKRGIELNATNCVLIKPNQIGTVTETIEAIKIAKNSGWKVVVSHRSGETEDTFISHLAVGLLVGQIKAGAPQRGERIAKYNELLRIEDFMGEQAVFAGVSEYEHFLQHLNPSAQIC